MTDTFIVDEAGRFVVGKAQTTPEDESVGFMRSSEDALEQWGRRPAQAFPGIVSGIFSGTAMLNRLLSRTGARDRRDRHRRAGGLPADRARDPDLPRLLLLGPPPSRHPLPQRAADPAGAGEGRARAASTSSAPRCCRCARRTPGRGGRAARRRGRGHLHLACCSATATPSTSCGWPRSSRRRRPSAGLDGEVPLFVSSQLYPMRRDLPRLNSTLIEAYAAEPWRGTLQAVRDETKEAGAGFELRVMASHGGTISIEAKELARTLVSGPIGGVVGGSQLAAGDGPAQRPLHRHRRHLLRHRPDHRRALRDPPDPRHRPLPASLPLVKIDSIGAGTGSFVRVNPNSNRPELGPDSAGSRIGVCWPEGGLRTLSVTDLDLVLGRVNPDYFLGGDVQLDPERARAEVERQVAAPLGLDVEQAAAGVIELFEQTLKTRRSARSSARATRPPTTRCSATAAAAPARRGLHRRRALPRRPRARLGGGLQRLRLRLRRLRVPLRPDDRHADHARPADDEKAGVGMISPAAGRA